MKKALTFETKAVAIINSTSANCDDIMSERPLKNHFSCSVGEFDENPNQMVAIDFRHQFATRELVFRSKFGSDENKLQDKTSAEPLANTEEKRQKTDIYMFAKDCFSKESPLALKNANIESEVLFFEAKEQNFCMSTAPSNLISDNLTITKLPEGLKNEEIVTIIEIPETRPQPNGEASSLATTRLHSPTQILNQDHSRQGSVNNQDNQRPQQTDAVIDPAFSEIESKIYLRRTMAFFSILAVCSFLLLFVIAGRIPVQPSCAILYCYWIYVIVDNKVEIKNLPREGWRRVEDLFNVFDGVCAIFAQICLQLKICNFIPYSLFACLPFAVMTIVYFFSKKCPNTQIFLKKTLTKLSCTIQILLITLKLDDIINWDWKIVFTLVWLFLLIIGFSFLTNALNLVAYALLYFFRQHLDHPVDFKTTFIGAFWYFIYHSMGVIGIFFYIGVDQVLQSQQSFEYLRYFSWISLFVNLFLVSYTKITFKSLQKYLQAHNHWSNSSELPSAQQTKKLISFQVEPKEAYFKIISPTYFLPLDKKSKQVASYLKATKPFDEKNGLTSVQELQEYKKVLDIKLKRNKLEKIRENSRRSAKKCRTEIPSQNKKIFQQKKINSFDDLDDYSRQTKPKNSQKSVFESINLCFICFQQPANAILIDCGHGGICYECSKKSIQVKNSCVTCRKKTEGICKIDSKSKVGNIVTSMEFVKVIEN